VVENRGIFILSCIWRSC